MLWRQVVNILTTQTVCATSVFVATLTQAQFCHKTDTNSVQQKKTCSQETIMAKPKLIVFDLDYTLWPFWVDTHVDPPFHMASNGKVYDAHKRHVTYYEDVPDILRRLHSEGYKLGIASRTGAVQEAADLTRLFNWDQYFHFRQIYPGSKITHFKKLQSESGIPFKDMLFFDDEHRNIADVSTLGVTCMFVPEGINNRSFQEGMDLFKSRRS